MRVAWLSDVHFNFIQRNELTAFVSSLVSTGSDAFLITGDIAEATTLTAHLTVLEKSLERPIYFVLGNHDFYRSGIAALRKQVGELDAQSRNLTYLSWSEPISLTPSTMLVGHDGWADGRFGDFHHSKVVMNDFEFIEDFRANGSDKTNLLRVMQALSDQAVSHFRKVIPEALANAEHVIVATHVPPFREASVNAGQASTDDFLPFFACRIVGDYLREVMKAHPKKRMTVYCGHSHGRGIVQILENLVVETAGAEYGAPEIQQIITID